MMAERHGEKYQFWVLDKAAIMPYNGNSINYAMIFYDLAEKKGLCP